MSISRPGAADFKKKIKSQGLKIKIGPIVVNIRSSIAAVQFGILSLYSDYPLEKDPGFADFQIGRAHV